LIWVPVFVEYIYRFIKGPEDKIEASEPLRKPEMQSKYMHLHVNEQHGPFLDE